MAWSLMNHLAADKVDALLDEQKDAYGPDVKRFWSREQAAAIIHAALWGHGVRESSTAACYAFMNLMEVLGIKHWAFDPEDASACQAVMQQRRAAQSDTPK